MRSPIPKISIAVLDYNRKFESKALLDSIERYASFDYELVYLSNGGNQSYALDYYKDGRIDRLILNKENSGCGILTRQAFQSCMGEYVLYLQVDHIMCRELTQDMMDRLIGMLKGQTFYIDLAGNQGNGNPSERASLFDRKKYLSMPKIDSIIGGPGPYADSQWTENYLQEYMSENKYVFITGSGLLFFSDNGKVSRRGYPCGGETEHYTDEKRIFVIKPLKKRYEDFPNLVGLTDEEWDMLMIGGECPKEGFIPEKDKSHSFIVNGWRDYERQGI